MSFLFLFIVPVFFCPKLDPDLICWHGTNLYNLGLYLQHLNFDQTLTIFNLLEDEIMAKQP